MKIDIFAKEIELTKNSKKYIEKKMKSLEKFINDDATCSFRVGKNSAGHENGKAFYAEASIKTSSKTYGARSEDGTLNEAIDHLKDELSQKIRRNKKKKVALLRRGERALKDVIKKAFRK